MSYSLRERDDRFDGPDPREQDEQLREQRWEAFKVELRSRRRRFCCEWDAIVRCAARAMDTRFKAQPVMLETTFREFADYEGWPATMRAIGQAMSEDLSALSRAMREAEGQS